MSNPIGVNTCYWSGTPTGESLTDMVDRTAELGADLIELNLGKILSLSKAGRTELRQRIEGLGMGAAVNGGLMSKDANLWDPAVRDAGLTHCRRAVEACADLGAPIWTGILHGVWGTRPEGGAGERSRRRKAAVQGLREAVKYAEERNMVFCLEVVNRYELFLLNTAAEGVSFCGEVESPHCKLLLDLFHMAIEEDCIPDAVRAAQAAEMIGSIHIGETNRRIPVGGKSNLDWPGIARAVVDSGYAGPLILEPFLFSGAPGAGNVSVWRDLADPADRELLLRTGRDGVAFLRSLLRRARTEGNLSCNI